MTTGGRTRRGASLGKRAAQWCAAEDPKIRCGVGPLARYLYVLRLLARGLVGVSRTALRGDLYLDARFRLARPRYNSPR
jgi:hypothetical protein